MDGADVELNATPHKNLKWAVSEPDELSIGLSGKSNIAILVESLY
jgi:hypothetical protein